MVRAAIGYRKQLLRIWSSDTRSGQSAASNRGFCKLQSCGQPRSRIQTAHRSISDGCRLSAEPSWTPPL